MSEETKEPISKSKLYIRYGLHMVLTIGVAAGVAWFSNEVILERAWNKQYLWYAGILLTVIALCSLLEKNKIYNSIRLVSMLSACFVVSALLLLLSDYYINLPIWLIGGIVAAALVNRNVGMLYLYYFVYHAIYLQGNWLNGLIFHFVTATLIAFLIPKMKTFLGMFYMMVFTACIVITGSVIHNRMTIEEEMLLDTFYILCTYLVCIFITMLLVKWTGLKQNVSDKAEQEVTNDYAYLDLLASQTAEQDAMLATLTKNSAEKEKLPEEETTDTGEVSVTEEEIDYSPYCNEKSELLLKLREQNKSLYAQAILVGKLASETAKSIGPARSPKVLLIFKPFSAKAEAHWLMPCSQLPAQNISKMNIQKALPDISSLIDIPLSSPDNSFAIGTRKNTIPFISGTIAHKTASTFQCSIPTVAKNRVDKRTTPTCPQQ